MHAHHQHYTLARADAWHDRGLVPQSLCLSVSWAAVLLMPDMRCHAGAGNALGRKQIRISGHLMRGNENVPGKRPVPVKPDVYRPVHPQAEASDEPAVGAASGVETAGPDLQPPPQYLADEHPLMVGNEEAMPGAGSAPTRAVQW